MKKYKFFDTYTDNELSSYGNVNNIISMNDNCDVNHYKDKIFLKDVKKYITDNKNIDNKINEILSCIDDEKIQNYLRNKKLKRIIK